MTIFVDLETSGLSPEHGAAILSIGLIADDGALTSPISELEIHVIPQKNSGHWQALQALEVNGLTHGVSASQWCPPPRCNRPGCDWLAAQSVWLGTEVVGQNPDFDYRFLRFFMLNELQCTGFPVDRNATDVIDLAKELLERMRVPVTSQSKRAAELQRCIDQSGSWSGAGTRHT